MERKSPPYSVLMSVYEKERPEYLNVAIQSMIEQTVQTDDFVIVCDGPLPLELDKVLQQFETQYPEIFRILRLERNQGLGIALNAGLSICQHTLVARMDSDDISLPHRCEHQLKKFERRPELALCSGAIAEFEVDPNKVVSIRHVPETHTQILQFAKRRNPMNHMAVMYKKDAVINAGGYIEINLAEDYYLWVRMLQRGYLAENLGEIVLKARIGNGMYMRRGGIKYARSMCALQMEFLRLKFISYPDFIINCIIRIGGSMIPNSWRKLIYQKKLRECAEYYGQGKMRVGILTYYNVHNYGAVLQMYALSKWLENKGVKVEIVKFARNYYQNTLENTKKYDLTFHSIPYYIRNIFSIGFKRTFYNFIKYLRLNKLKRKEIKFGKYYYEYTPGELDYVIIGSDEVFAMDIGFNPWFYGIGLNANSVLSYAGSFGKTCWENITDTHIQKIVEDGFKNFSAISVRDQNSQLIIKKISNLDASLVCDPVFLYGFRKYINKKRINKKQYLLLYSYDNNFNKQNEIDCIKRFAKRNNLKIISVGYYHKWCDKNVMPDVMNLFEWFQNAQYIITDTFHGAVISILVNGEFAVLIRDNKNKLQFLLDEYDLISRCSYEVEQVVKILDNRINYEITNKLLKRSVEQSKCFLDKNIYLR